MAQEVRLERASLELTERQREILLRVVEEHVHTGQPVGSKSLVERSALAVSPSTVRSELAELERLQLLTHPHTSAGRVPTDRGYRYYAGERMFLDALRPAFAELGPAEETRLYVGGAASLFEGVRANELDAYRHLLEVLERRAALLELLGRTLDPHRPFVRLGHE